MRFPFTDEELFPAVERALDSVRGALRKDGGDIELLRVRQKEVFVRLTGACAACNASSQTLKKVVERAIRSRIHPEMIVIDSDNENVND
ncbi:MAG: NifU family protein [Helicobacteraceae bacterium]|jgi:Fe-S cluster biogenesis protein NfuA|nr:NifU family protein [Helicobacteraceae bacterium]